MANGGKTDLFADGYEVSPVGVLSIIHARNINGQVHGVFISSYAAGQWLAIDEVQNGRPVYEQSGDIVAVPAGYVQ